MVSVRFDSRPTADERPNAERRFRGKEVHLWSPRASPRDRETWVEEVDEAMRTSQPKIPRWILEGPPTKEEINKLHKEATSEVRATKYSEALHEYQEWNTIFWDMIEPTLDFSGAYADVDRLSKRKFMHGELRDGVGYRQFAIGLAWEDPVQTQVNAVSELSSYPRLDANAQVTIVQLDQHLNGLLAKWLAVQGNGEQNYVDFRTRMLISLPDEPMTAKVVLVRQHLAEIISLGPPESKTPEALLSAASKRAKMLAMPAGDVSKEVVAPFVDVKLKDGGPKDTPRRQQESDPSPISKYRPRAGQNKCPLCPVDLCKAEVWAKAKNDKDIKKFCLTCSLADPTKQLPHYQASGANAPTSSELIALKVCQEAFKRDPTIKLKEVSLSLLKKGNAANSNATAGGTQGQLTPLISLQALMGEAADQISDPAEFGAWAASMGVDLLTPVVEMLEENDESVETAVQDSGAGVTPSYWAPVGEPEFDANDAAARDSVAVALSAVEAEAALRLKEVEQTHADEMRVMREENARLQQRLMAPRTTDSEAMAPAPPTSAREVPEHMRPVYGSTPLPNSSLAALRSGASAPPLPTVEEIMDVDANKKKRNAAKVNPAEAYSNGMAYMAIGMGAYERHIAKLKKQLGERSWTRPFKWIVDLPLALGRVLMRTIRAGAARLPRDFAGMRDVTLYGVALLVAVEKIGPLATPYARAALVNLLRIGIGVVQRAFARMASYVRDATATRTARMLAAAAAAIGRQTTQLPQLGGVSNMDVMYGRGSERELTAAEAIAGIGAEILSPMQQVEITAEEIKLVQAGKMQPRLGTAGMRVIVDENELLAALPSNAIPERAELSDNGASTGVAKTLLGVIPGTKRSATSNFAVANDKTIGSTVTHYHAYYRCGVDGKIPTLRRKHYLPEALCNIGSEGEDVYCAKQGYWFDAPVGRVVFDALKPGETERKQVKLHMSPNNLGWYWMEAITDAAVIRQLLVDNQVIVKDTIAPCIKMLPQWFTWPCVPNVAADAIALVGQHVLAPINPHTGVSMNRPAKLSGYEILCRMHVVLGHPGLATMLITLAGLKGTAGMVTKADIEEYRRRRCGLCESMLMNTPPFKTSQSLQPLPEPGQYWTRDTVSLRVPTFQFKWKYMTLYTDKRSSYWLLIGHTDYTAETVTSLDQQLRTFNRPINGEVLRIKADNHPSYKAKNTIDYLSESEIGPQFSPAYGHQMVGEAEVGFRVLVPRSNALLKGCPTDNGEEHEAFAMFTACSGRNAMLHANGSPSPGMIFHRYSEVVLESQVAFGAPVKFLKWPEQRDSKFDEHARAGSFRGPSRESLDETPKLCWVLTTRADGRKEMATVHMGCVRVDERPVIARTTMSHPSHQPFGDPQVERPMDREPDTLDFSMWRDVAAEGYPDDRRAECMVSEQQNTTRLVWQPSALPPDAKFIVGICGGSQGYPADMWELVDKISDHECFYFPIDLHVGGHAHNITLPHVQPKICDMLKHVRCNGVGLSPECKAVSALLCFQPGPNMVFNTAEPDGIANLSPKDAVRRDDALQQYTACCAFARAVTCDGNKNAFVWWEGPVKRGTGSAFKIVGQEMHSSVFEMTLFTELAAELNMRPVYVDQGSAGATSPKTTAIWCTPSLATHLDPLLGALPLAPPPGDARTVGFDANGVSRAKPLARYPLDMRARLACAMVRTVRNMDSSRVVPAAEIQMAAIKPAAEPTASAPLDIVSGGNAALNLTPDTPATTQAPPAQQKSVTFDTTGGLSVAQLADKFEEALGTTHSSGGVVTSPLQKSPTEAKAVTSDLQKPPKAVTSALKKPPPVPRAEYEAALARKEAGTSLPNDEVTLSTAVSRGIVGFPSKARIDDEQNKLTECKLKHPVRARCMVKWADSDSTWYAGRVTGYKIFASGKGAAEKAHISIKYDDGEHMWHEIDQTEIKHAARSKTLVIDGERSQALTSVEEEEDTPQKMSEENEMAGVIACISEFHGELLASVIQASEHMKEELKADLIDRVKADAQSDMFTVGAHDIVLPMVDVETGELMQVMAAVVSTGTEAVTVSPNEADRWHLPKSHKEYLQSPFRANWRTAMELKMEKYEAVPTWSLVDIKSVPRGTRIYRLKWAYTMKSIPDSVNLKFAPRLCLVGTGMDPTIFPSYADVGRKITLNIVGAILATYMEHFTAHQADTSDAFQNTVVDGSDGEKPGPTLYSYQAPDFETKGDNGAQLVCKHRTAFQGRIDSPRVYGAKVRPMLKKAGFHPLMYDPESFIYHEGPTKGTCATLDEILETLKTLEPNSPGHPPHGYSLMVRHVDDKVMIVTDPKITEYMIGHVRNTYACTYTGWKKVLGWDAIIDRDERTVSFECPSVLEAAKNRFLRDSSLITPRHIMTPSLMDLELGEVPPEGDPDRASMLAMQAEGASLLGLMIWITERYPQGLFVTRWVGRKSHSMSWDGYRFLKFALMHLLAHPYATHWGGEQCRSLELSSPIKQPHTNVGQEWGMYAMADANVGYPKSMTGVVVMLAGGQVDSVCQSQQCISGESHTTEVVAGGTALNRIIPARGTLQEMHCPQERATPCYFDSATTIFVSNDDAAVKRALWLRRRVAVLRAGVEDQEFEPMKIPEADNAPDMFTKYLTYPVWHKHATFINNMTPAREKKACARQVAHRSVKSDLVAPPPSQPPPSPPPSPPVGRRSRRGRRRLKTRQLSLAFTRWMQYACRSNRCYWTRWVRPDGYDSSVELDMHNAAPAVQSVSHKSDPVAVVQLLSLDEFWNTYGTGAIEQQVKPVVDLRHEVATPPLSASEPPTRTCVTSAWNALTRWWNSPVVGTSASSFNIQETLRYPTTGWLASCHRLTAMSDATVRRSNGLPSDREVKQLEDAVAWHAEWKLASIVSRLGEYGLQSLLLGGCTYAELRARRLTHEDVVILASKVKELDALSLATDPCVKGVLDMPSSDPYLEDTSAASSSVPVLSTAARSSKRVRHRTAGHGRMSDDEEVEEELRVHGWSSA